MAAKWERQSQKRNLSSRTSCRIFQAKIRILCKEWLNYLDALNFAAAPLQGPWFPLSPVSPGGTLNQIPDPHTGGGLTPSAVRPLYFSKMPLYSLWPSPTFCLVPLQCLSSLHTWELPVSRVQWPTFSDMLSVTHKTHSLSHCPQHPLAICNSIFKAPVAFCPRPYQHVIIACLNVSLLDSIRSPLQTNYFPCSFLDPHA